MIIDGKKIAEALLEELQKERDLLPHQPRLGIVVGTEDLVTSSYVRIKERLAKRLGVTVVHEELLPGTTLERAIVMVQQLCRTCDGIIVQLPLQGRTDTEAILAAIDPVRDIDAINPNVKEFERVINAPVAEAIAKVLGEVNADVRGKKAMVVGTGRLVGGPAALYLRSRGAEVSVVTKEKGSLNDLKEADIVVLGAGTPGLVKPEMLKEGVILIDGGTSEQSGHVVGDADPACAEIASVFTPVPGGIGPIAVVMLFKNLFELVRHHR